MTPEIRTARVAALCRSGWRGCLLGPEGTGKTTLLEDLEAPVRAAGREVRWFRLNRQASARERGEATAAMTALDGQTVVFLDGGEVLGRLPWALLLRSLRRRGTGILATLHRPSGLPVLHQTRPELRQALDFTRELAGPVWTPDLESVARRAFAASRGNMREVFRAAYWYCARL